MTLGPTRINRRGVMAVAAALATLAGPAGAHHSLAGYDGSRPTELNGEVVEFSFTNPHPFVVIAVKPAERWKLEMDNLYELVEVGMKRDTLRPGDKVQVSGSPDRTGARQMYLRRLDRPVDGLLYEQVGMSPKLRLPNSK